MALRRCERCLLSFEGDSCSSCDARANETAKKMAECWKCPFFRAIGPRGKCSKLAEPYLHTPMMWRGEVCPIGNHDKISPLTPPDVREEDFQDPTHGKPGTCLRKLADWLKAPGECDCKDMAAKMDRWGVEGCQRRENQIVAHIVDQKDHLKPWFKIPATVLADVGARMMLKRAIQHASQPTMAHKLFLRPVDVPRLDCTLITACDAGFLRGAYTAIWTAMRHNLFNEVLLYDLGIGQSPMLDDIRSWGVRVVRPPLPLRAPKVNGWQTYMKPDIIKAAMATSGRVMWLDADTVTTGTLEGLLWSLPDTGYIMPDHGHLSPAANENSNEFRDVLDEPQRWSGAEYPCAGIGVYDSRSLGFIDAWIDRVGTVFSRKLFDRVAYFDQGCVQGIYEGPRADGRIYNDLGMDRKTCESWNGFEQVVRDRTAKVLHFGGPRKPWQRWGWRNLTFGDPRS